MNENLNQIVANHNARTQKPSPSNYIMAALPSYRQHIQIALDTHPEYVTYDNIIKYQNITVNKFLSSYGIGMIKGKPLDENVTKRYMKLFDKITTSQFLGNTELTIDSGGYQLQVGYGKKEETSTLIKLYHDFLKAQHSKIDYAFSLDLAPGATTCLYDSWTEMENYNRESYQASADLPKEVRDKMIYIHHFRTPKIKEVWTGMLDDGMADSFQHFGTGGLVSFANSSQSFPVVMYVVPLIQILTYALKRGLKKFRFHVLGGSEFKDILFHKFAERHIREKYGIEVEITYDSSTIFKVLGMSRFLYVGDFNTNNIWKMTVREQELQMMFRNTGKTHSEVMYDCMNNACVPAGMKAMHPDTDPIYGPDLKGIIDKKTKKTKIVMTRMAYMYGIFHMLKMYRDVDHNSNVLVDRLYPLYQAGCTQEFDTEIEKVMIGWNNGKNSKRIRARTMSIANSLDALTQLDLDYTDHLVDRYMGGDECLSLTNKSLTTF